jgi:hypothetical protein
VSVSPLLPLPHPLVVAVEQIEGALAKMPLGAWDGLASTEVKAMVERLMRIESRVKAQQIAAARVLDASGLATSEGATSTGAMLAVAFGGDRRAGDQLVRVAKALESATRTESALAKGEIATSQAAIIAAAVSDLPPGTTPEERQACEDTLIGDAGRFSLKDLRRRSLRITDQFKPAPEVDRIENDALVDRERLAWATSEFWMVDNNDGTVKGGFVLPEVQADMLRTAIEAISAPRRDHLHDHPAADNEDGDSMYDRDLSYRTRLGMGFAELCGHLPTDQLPGRGGRGATLLVKFDYDTLAGGVKAASLSTGTRVSAGEVRQMACRLGMIPTVFDGKSLPIDHGAEQRCFTRSQRAHFDERDGGCTFPGCDRPPGWTEAHHARLPFSIGRTTHLDEGVLLCPFHHRQVHDHDWRIRFNPSDGHPEYRLPGEVTWQRNQRWRP